VRPGVTLTGRGYCEIPIVRISELASQADCDLDTVRYYESIGLLGSRSAPGDDVAYGEADVARLRFIAMKVASGMDVEALRILLASCDDEVVETTQRARPDVPSGPLIRKGRLRSGQ
jgi:DNA-binding transcriptional MerR regulator